MGLANEVSEDCKYVIIDVSMATSSHNLKLRVTNPPSEVISESEVSQVPQRKQRISNVSFDVKEGKLFTSEMDQSEDPSVPKFDRLNSNVPSGKLDNLFTTFQERIIRKGWGTMQGRLGHIVF